MGFRLRGSVLFAVIAIMLILILIVFFSIVFFLGGLRQGFEVIGVEGWELEFWDSRNYGIAAFGILVKATNLDHDIGKPGVGPINRV